MSGAERQAAAGRALAAAERRRPGVYPAWLIEGAWFAAWAAVPDGEAAAERAALRGLRRWRVAP
jgi:hypothetical protein